MVSLTDVLLAMSNIPVSDPIAEIWGRGLQGGYKIIEYTGTLPAVLTGTKAGYLESYKIYGNTIQNGTPTPEAPVDVAGCGVRTENLFDKDNYNLIRANAETGQNILYGTPTESPYAVYIPVTGGETYSFYSQSTLESSCFTMATPAIGVSIVVNGANTFNNTNVRTAPADAKYLVIFLELSSVTQDKLDFDLATLTIVKSSTPPASYIPYGYKLPILSNSTVTNIYLGKAETTRRIKKLVLTGSEDIWHKSATRNYSWYIFPVSIGTIENTPFYCSHGETVTSISDYTYGKVFCDNTCNLGIFDSSIDSVAKLNAYLAAQYAAGTPVTIWYVLKNPETGIVNEPLMKIGDYADTLSMEQADVSIPTIDGDTTIDYDGAPKPSQMYIKYRR